LRERAWNRIKCKALEELRKSRSFVLQYGKLFVLVPVVSKTNDFS
jgi:hypothetical protein